MDFFNCCKSVNTGSGYEIKTRKSDNKESDIKFLQNPNQIDQKILNSLNTSIIKLTKSDYDLIAKDYKKDKKWTDPIFSPSDLSLGNFTNIKSDKWRRISDFVQNPVIFSDTITPNDCVQSQYGDNVFLASVASFAENVDRVRDLFGNQKFNPNGFYKVLLRVHSQVQQIIIDDYVPVNEDGFPVFAKPYKNQIWVMLLQKARAKLYGSYQKMLRSGASPKQVYQQITLAPTEEYKTPIGKSQIQKFWRIIQDNSQRNRPICALSGNDQGVNWNFINLLPNHYYSLIDAASLKHQNGIDYKILKIRNAFSKTQWKGDAHQGDNLFWGQIQHSQQKIRFLGDTQAGKDGIFYMTFTDFLKYFTKTYINFHEKYGSYLTQSLFFNQKNALIYTLKVTKQGFYNIEIDQQKMDQSDDGWARSTIIVARQHIVHQNKKDYEYIDGFLKYHEPLSVLKTRLLPGDYIVYVKLDPTIQKKRFPTEATLILYSEQKAKLQISVQPNHPDFLKKTFLAYGRDHKRQLYNDDKMWMSWKLVNQGGFGFIAFGNDISSKQKFVVILNQADFVTKGFKLKKPFKHNGKEQVLQVFPGTQDIILARIENSTNKDLKFPPTIDVKILPAE